MKLKSNITNSMIAQDEWVKSKLYFKCDNCGRMTPISEGIRLQRGYHPEVKKIEDKERGAIYMEFSVEMVIVCNKCVNKVVDTGYKQ